MVKPPFTLQSPNSLKEFVKDSTKDKYLWLSVFLALHLSLIKGPSGESIKLSTNPLGCTGNVS